jgi:hypothetical protein
VQTATVLEVGAGRGVAVFCGRRVARAPRPRSANRSSPQAPLHTALRGADVDVELVAPPDATMSAALGLARDVDCDHIVATDAAKGHPPFAPGGIAGPRISLTRRRASVALLGEPRPG